VSDFVVLLSASLTALDFAILDLDLLPEEADGLGGANVPFDLVVEIFDCVVVSLLPAVFLVEERVTRLFGSGAPGGSTDSRRRGGILASCSPCLDWKMQTRVSISVCVRGNGQSIDDLELHVVKML
jgi:hypothetical protein